MRYRKHALHPLTCWAGIAALLASITLSFPASAATYTVTNLNDSGAGSLRQAILDANATLGVADTIEFDPSVTGTITLTTGEIQITDKLTLNGPGEAVLTISGNQSSRIFNVKTMNTTMSSLTLKDGKAFSNNGGAILNQGSLTLKQITFTNNNGNLGGAIKNDGVLTMSDIIVTGSSASQGGAFYSNGIATLNNGTFSGNTSTTYGGAILNTSGSKLTINRAVFDSNQSGNSGGVIDNSGILSLNESSFSANQAKGNGGAISSSGSLSVTNSLFAQNRSAIDGGGIYTTKDTTVYNSTFSQNYAERNGGAIYASYSPPLTLLNDTLTGNYAGSSGGSVWFNGTLTIGNTISIGNFAPTKLEIYKDGGTLTSQGNNLFGSNTIFGGSDAASSGYSDLTIQSTDSILTEEPETVIDPLMDNGGFTQTHALIPGSPAIDAGGNSIVPTELTTDQRGVGFPRIVGDRVDIGAFEVGDGAAPTAYPLTITLAGKGSVISDPTGVTCSGTTCSGSFPIDAEVTLMAKPLTGFTFSGWSGACTNKTGTCAVTMSEAQTATATFTAAPVSYNLTLTRVGDGTVTSSPAGINCGTGTGCAAKFASGKTITLTAVPATGATFVKWNGCTASATDSKKCTLTLTANKTVTATFTTIPAATADFIITGIILTPANPQTNGLFAANITVKNQGTSAADGGTLSVWTNRATKPVCSTGGDKAVPVGNIAAGGTKILVIQELVTGAGNKTLHAFVDSKCVTQEANETNNQLTKSYTVK